MKLCSDGHDEVCYVTPRCPVCVVIVERDTSRDALNKAVEAIDELEGDLEEIQTAVED